MSSNEPSPKFPTRCFFLLHSVGVWPFVSQLRFQGPRLWLRRESRALQREWEELRRGASTPLAAEPGTLRRRDGIAPAATPYRAGRVPPFLRGGEPARGNQPDRRWLCKPSSSRPGAMRPGTAQGGKTWRGAWHGPPGTLGFCPYTEHQAPLGSGRDRVIGGEPSPPGLP